MSGDLGDAAALRAALAAAQPECVIHLAAEIATQRDPAKIDAVNVEGTRRLLEACAEAGRPRFLFTSTVVTGDAHGALLDESSELRSRPPTGARSRRASAWSASPASTA